MFFVFKNNALFFYNLLTHFNQVHRRNVNGKILLIIYSISL